MDTSFSHLSFGNEGNNSVVYHDQIDNNTSPTQQLNYTKPNQQQLTGLNRNGGNLQRKSSLLYQHYTSNENNGSRIMSETGGNYTVGSDYYNGNQSFSNINDNNAYGTAGNATGDIPYWNNSNSINQSPIQQTSNLQGTNMSYRNITAPIFNNSSNINGYAGYSPSTTTMVSGTLPRGAKSPVSGLQSTSGNEPNLKRAISIKNSSFNPSADTLNDFNETKSGSPFNSKKISNYSKQHSNINEEGDENYKMELKIKDSQIESLEQEIENLKKMIKLKTSGTLKLDKKDNGLNFNGKTDFAEESPNNLNGGRDILDIKNVEAMDDNQDSFFFQIAKRNTNSLDDELYIFPEIPNSINELILRLSKKNEANNEKIKDLETRLDSIVTAVMMNPMNISGNGNMINNVSTDHGRYDEEAIAHKLVVRLETLTKENEEMGKMLSYGRSKEYQIDIKLLKRENEILKAKISELVLKN
ncbi:hypothetical protein QEN19_001024 [Hanseniaspora menglaensis]